MVHFLRKHLVNRTIASCQGFSDEIVYGKKGGTDADTFAKAVTGRKVLSAGQQGKYFYLTFDQKPHSVMHLGMTGWIKCSVEDFAYYKQAKEDGKKPEAWPPQEKWTKWLIKCDAEGDREAVELAFVDPRRLGRISLIDCEAEDIRNTSPLKENGPDPFIDKDIVTAEWLSKLLNKKKVPVKALLLDQANISGVGNWVADEIMYQAKLHPEQYSNTFDEQQIKQLHDALISVTTTACETLADSSQFPEDWLMKHRWDKGKKGDVNKLPNGAKIEHITVGGRTSAFVPSVQRKTAAVAGDLDTANGEGKVEKKPTKGRKRKVEAEDDEQQEEDEVEEVVPAKKARGKKPKVEADAEPIAKRAPRGQKAKVEPTEAGAVQTADDEAGNEEEAPKTKKPRATPKKESKPVLPGERQSSRNKAAAEPAPANGKTKKTSTKKGVKPVLPGERKSARGKK